MLLRVAVFLMMALGLVGFATIAWFSLQPPQANASNDELHKEHILVAARDLRPGALLKPDDIGMQPIDQEKIPEGASPDTPVARHAMIGAMVRRPMTAGEVMLPHDILRPVERGFLAAVLGDGMRAVTVGVDAITGTAGLIWPGDHVDVLLLQTIEDATRPLRMAKFDGWNTLLPRPASAASGTRAKNGGAAAIARKLVASSVMPQASTRGALMRSTTRPAKVCTTPEGT